MDDFTIYLILLALIWIPYLLSRGGPREEEWILEAVIPVDYPRAQPLMHEEIDVDALIEEELRRRSQLV